MLKTETEASNQKLGLEERRAFMKLPLEERRRQIAVQAAQMVEHYEPRTEVIEREQWQGGDLVECE